MLKRSSGARHSAAVVHNFHERFSAVLEFYFDARSPRVYRVFEKLFCDRRWAFDNLARRDFVCDVVGENAYFWRLFFHFRKSGAFCRKARVFTSKFRDS